MRFDGIAALALALFAYHGQAAPVDEQESSALHLLGKRAVCGGVKYSNVAMQQGFEHAIDAYKHNSRLKGSAKMRYPHSFRNDEELNSPSCKKGTPGLFEFPVYPDGKAWRPGMDPGADRAVVRDHGNGVFTQCQFMTHTGAARRNGFARCSAS